MLYSKRVYILCHMFVTCTVPMLKSWLHLCHQELFCYKTSPYLFALPLLEGQGGNLKHESFFLSAAAWLCFYGEFACLVWIK
jgi:hypothetical protein